MTLKFIITARPTITSSSPSPSATNTSSTSPTHKTSLAPIIGGVVGGVLCASLFVAVVIYIRRRPSKWQPQLVEIEPSLHQDFEKMDESRSGLPSPWSPHPPEPSTILPTLAPVPMRLYVRALQFNRCLPRLTRLYQNPEDPSTYPPQDLPTLSFPDIHAMPHPTHYHSGPPPNLPQV